MQKLTVFCLLSCQIVNGDSRLSHTEAKMLQAGGAMARAKKSQKLTLTCLLSSLAEHQAVYMLAAAL